MSMINGRRFGSISAGDLVSARFNRFLRTHVGSAVAYGGPEYWMKNPNRFFVPATTDAASYLTSNKEGNLSYLLNVCSHYHRPVYLPDEAWTSGYMGSLNGGLSHCGGHKWAYNPQGIHIAPVRLRVEPGSETESEQHCTDLHSALMPGQSVEAIGGLIWVGTPKQLEPTRRLLLCSLARELGLTNYVPSNYRLVRVWVDRAQFSSFTGMVIFEDLNHPGKGVHPGKLDVVVDMRGQRRNYLPEFGVSMQVVPWVNDVDYSKMSRYWAAYHKYVKEAVRLGIVDHTVRMASWLADYNSFFTHEEYPLFIVNSWFVPTEDGVRNVVEFYVPQEVLERVPKLAGAAIAAYMGKRGHIGIAQEDARLAQGCDKGMRILAERGRGNQLIGPLDPTSDGAVYDFHRFMAEHWEHYKVTHPWAP